MSNVRRLVLSLFNVLVAFGLCRRSSGAPATRFAELRHLRTLLRRSFLIVQHGSALANRTVAHGRSSRRGLKQQRSGWSALPVNAASPNLSVERTC